MPFSVLLLPLFEGSGVENGQSVSFNPKPSLSQFLNHLLVIFSGFCPGISPVSV
jgi:hypothetical protein